MCSQVDRAIKFGKLVFFDDSRKPTLWGHFACGIGVAALAGSIWMFTSWSVAKLHRGWGFCQPIGLMGSDKKVQDSSSHPPISSSTPMSTLGETIWPWRTAVNPTTLRELTPFPATPPLKNAELFQDLNRQAGIIAYLEWRNCDVTSYFINRQLSTFSMATTMAMISLGTLVIISKNGWDKTNNAWINLSITSGLITAGALNYSALFGFSGEKPNSDRFMAAYNRASDLSSRLRSASKTLTFDIEDTSKTPPTVVTLDLNKSDNINTLINYLNREIQTVNVVNASFDLSFVKKAGETISPSFSPQTSKPQAPQASNPQKPNGN